MVTTLQSPDPDPDMMAEQVDLNGKPDATEEAEEQTASKVTQGAKGGTQECSDKTETENDGNIVNGPSPGSVMTKTMSTIKRLQAEVRDIQSQLSDMFSAKKLIAQIVNSLSSGDQIHSSTLVTNANTATENQTENMNTGTIKQSDCETCGVTSAEKKRLKSHEDGHNDDCGDDCTCVKCATKFREKHCLSQHMHSHSGRESELKCSVCEETFDEKGNLIVHEQLHDIGDMKMVGALNDSEDLKITKYYSSTDPDINGENTSRDHESSTHGTKFKEKHCHESHTGEKTLQDEVFMCSSWENIFASDIGLEGHKKKEYELLEVSVSNSLADERSIENHINNGINDAPIFKCQECGWSCTEKTSLTQHMQAHTGNSSECVHWGTKFKDKCNTCGQKSGRREGLIQHAQDQLLDHRQTHHGKISVNENKHRTNGKSQSGACGISNVPVSTPSPKSEIAISSDVCEDRFSQKEDLKMHMEIHEKSTAPPAPRINNTALECVECSTSVDEKEDFNLNDGVHRRNLRNPGCKMKLLKTLNCTSCEITYHEKGDLESHIKHEREENSEINNVISAMNLAMENGLDELEVHVENLMPLQHINTELIHMRNSTEVVGYCTDDEGGMQNVQNPFQTEDILFEHVCVHTGESQADMQCQLCDTPFSREDEQDNHRKGHHQSPGVSLGVAVPKQSQNNVETSRSDLKARENSGLIQNNENNTKSVSP